MPSKKYSDWLVAIRSGYETKMFEVLEKENENIEKMIMTKHYHSELGTTYYFALRFNKSIDFNGVHEKFQDCYSHIEPVRENFNSFIDF